MKKYQQILTCALGAAFLFLFAACGNETEQSKIVSYVNSAQADFYTESAAEYLRKNGYPEDFIANTGDQTKGDLQRFGAVFQAKADGALPSHIGSKLKYSLTISDASEGRTSKKYLTLNWRWDEPRAQYVDHASFTYNETSYELNAEECIFEIFGQGKLESSYIPENCGVEIPETESGTFLYFMNWRFEQMATLQRDTDSNTVRWEYTFSPDNMFRKIFSDETSQNASSEDAAYGDYSLNGNIYGGSLTICLEASDIEGDFKVNAAYSDVFTDRTYGVSTEISPYLS